MFIIYDYDYNLSYVNDHKVFTATGACSFAISAVLLGRKRRRQSQFQQIAVQAPSAQRLESNSESADELAKEAAAVPIP